MPIPSGDSGSTQPPPPAASVPSPEEEALVGRLAEEMAAAWQRGERPLAEEFLALHAEVAANPELALQLVYEEVCLRQQHGEEVDLPAVLRRFPQWRSELAVLLDCHRLLHAAPADPDFPAAGENLGDYQLRAELGRGAQGRVFLAGQGSLADRPVVLKLMPGDGREHLALARLQHTHVVPLYGAHVFPDRNLRALCMPYLGGATLARLLEELPPSRRGTGKDLLAALDALQARSPVALPSQGPARRLLARMSFGEAVCWVGACLAEALQYAHERGLVHLDLKPSNVLLAADGQPLLLDFHLAREPLRPGGPVPEWFGGTPAFMSPEQRQAFQAVREGRPVPAAVDHRSDIYSLGLLLYRTLAGEEAAGEPPGDSLPRLEGRNPEVSPGLADVLHKCLARAPEGRYPSAAALAADLRRHLNHLPLQGVANRSWRERWAKWRRRRPHALFLGLLLVFFLGAALAGGVFLLTQVRGRLEEARVALAQGRQLLRQGQFDRAEETLARGRSLAESTLGGSRLAGELADQLRGARRGQAIRQLHAAVEQVRFFHAADALPRVTARKLDAVCRHWWGQRGQLLDRDAGELDPGLERQVRDDLLDLAITWADLQVWRAEEDEKDQARGRAARMLTQAEELLGPSPVLQYEKQVLVGKPVRSGPARPKPRTAWEHYQLGRSLLHQGELERAAAEFDRSLEMEPQHFWPNFYQGLCAYRRNHPREAVQAFSVCIALAPRTAACYYNRGRAQEALGRADLAERDYGRALRLDPDLAAAALNRGLLRYRAGDMAGAAADLGRVLRLEPQNEQARKLLEVVRRKNDRAE